MQKSEWLDSNGNQVLINIKNENDAIINYFKNKDLVSVDDLLGAIENLLEDVDYLEEKIKDIETPNEPDYYKEWRDNNACR